MDVTYVVSLFIIRLTISHYLFQSYVLNAKVYASMDSEVDAPRVPISTRSMVFKK
jgi:hypothetical protein